MSPIRLFVVSALLHAYLGLRIVPDLRGSAWLPGLVASGLLASALLVPLGLLARGIRPQRRSDRLATVGLLAMGLLSSLLVLTAARDLLLLGMWAASHSGLASPATSAWVAGSALAVPTIAVAVTAWGVVNARKTAHVVTVDVPISGLPPALDGFTIAQISDIHVGPTIKGDYLRRIVTAVNRLAPDMVAVTGDLVDGSVRDLSAQVEPLASLASRHGSFFVTGNHEYYSGAAAWVAELRRLGLTVLMNQHVVLQHAGAPLVIAGVTDFSAHHFDPAQRSDPQAALAGAPAEATTRVLLAHQPRSAEAAARAGFQLQLSGHTHGGQFLPWNFFVRLQQPFTAGLHRWQRLWVYTSRGTGYWGPPIRFGAPSEITLLRLSAAAA